jgi:hypothetical protein
MNRETPCCPCCGKPTTLYAFRGQPWPKEDEAYRLRIKNLAAEFQMGGYNTYDRDVSVAVAVAQLMVVEGTKPHLERLLAFHVERIAAGSLV